MPVSATARPVVPAAVPAAVPTPTPAIGVVPPPVGLYLHVPFCLSLCPYCDFPVVTGRASRGPASRIPAFVAALHAELDLRADALDAAVGATRPPLDTVYLGGGTPSLLGAPAVGELLDHVARRFGVAAGAEITLEANPGIGERGDAPGFVAAGVTRLSFGAQSLATPELRALGRRHRPADVLAAVREARAAGIASVNLDLLIDVPGQALASWGATLDAALALEPDHVSAYALTLEDPDEDGLTGPLGDHLPVRPGARRWRAAARAAQDPDRAADMDALAGERLAAAGLARYELSNHARPGHESRHNLGYWLRRPILAAGPGAHAFDGRAERSWNAARLDGWLAALLPTDGAPPRLPPGGAVTLTDADARSEAAILGLRLREGIPAAAARDPLLAEGLTWARSHGLLEAAPGDRLRLTAHGRLVSNEVFQRLLP
ncbi:MAG: coproporphyrinogen-III oxidase family protein [Chloroflexota bacterium]